jgi:tRNA threonylcarbamoyladenosine biosynthesis protein TsaB
MEKCHPVILAIDTATAATGIAITRGTRNFGKVVASLGLSSNVTHSRRLLSSIDWLMQQVEIGWEDIHGIGVSLGPGSFTGLRIVMATAKGLVTATGLQLLGVSTLDVLASSCLTERLVCSVIDARKKEVYAAFYKTDSNGCVIRMSDIAAFSPAALAALIKDPVLMVGDGAVAYKELFEQELGGNFSIASSEQHEPSAAALGLMCGEQFLAGNVLPVDSAVPLYVRSSDAELNLQKKQQAFASSENPAAQ